MVRRIVVRLVAQYVGGPHVKSTGRRHARQMFSACKYLQHPNVVVKAAVLIKVFISWQLQLRCGIVLAASGSGCRGRRGSRRKQHECAPCGGRQSARHRVAKMMSEPHYFTSVTLARQRDRLDRSRSVSSRGTLTGRLESVFATPLKGYEGTIHSTFSYPYP